MTAVSPAAPTERVREHAVSVYDQDADLITLLASHLLDRSLRMGHPAIVVATAEHLSGLDAELRDRGVDPDDLRSDGYLHTLDARVLLDGLLVDGLPDPQRFREQVGALIARVGQGGPLAVFGEMVALLWDQGNVRAAMRLEELWNELPGEIPFTLLCAYPTATLATHADLGAVSGMCRLHTAILPPERYRALPVELDPRETAQIFLAVPQAISGVRRWLTETLTAWGESAPLDDVLIAASELATNAVLHARSAFRATISRGGGVIRVGFEDLAAGHPALNSDETELPGGRGVHLVEQLALRWGVDARVGSKVVWAEFPSAS